MWESGNTVWQIEYYIQICQTLCTINRRLDKCGGGPEHTFILWLCNNFVLYDRGNLNILLKRSNNIIDHITNDRKLANILGH